MKSPLDNIENRAHNITTPEDKQLGIVLEDIDGAIIGYLENIVIPTLQLDGKTLTVPVIYGNAERWVSARRDGFLRDQRGQIQIPLVMIKRNNLNRDDSMQLFDRNVTYPSIKKYSKRNRYDRFSLLNNINPEYEVYNITMPTYVTITYESIMWTNYTEHMNKLIEAVQFAGNEYWGDKDRFKFKTKIDSFDTEQSMAEGSERVIKTMFSLEVNGYLLPEMFNNKPTTSTGYTTKQTIISTEIDKTLK